ncbi:hypothetical protein ACRRTK_014288 [Alexandromys fortis]
MRGHPCSYTEPEFTRMQGLLPVSLNFLGGEPHPPADEPNGTDGPLGHMH